MTTQGQWNRFCATWAITMLVLSPSVATTQASAVSIPASIRTSSVEGVALDEPPGPVLGQAGERLGVVVDDGDVVPVGGHAGGDRRADPAASNDQEFHASSLAA